MTAADEIREWTAEVERARRAYRGEDKPQPSATRDAERQRAYRRRNAERLDAIRAKRKAELVRTWTCATCDEHGEGVDADDQAARHVRRSAHSTNVSSKPREEL